MSPSTLFIRRPVATTLLTLGIALAGAIAFFHLRVAPLPDVAFPTIEVEAALPGASPEVMATSVATPLERHLGVISDVDEMTSESTEGQTRITLQFGLGRNIDGAARDVQAAINAARADLPANMRSNPTYHKWNPADAPFMIYALTSNTLSQGQLYDAATTILQQKLSQISGVGEVRIGGSSLPAVRVDLNPLKLFKYGIGLEDVRAALAAANAHSPKGSIANGDRRYQIYTNDQSRTAADYRPLVIAYRNGAAVRLFEVARVTDSVENVRNAGLANGKPAVLAILYQAPGANVINAVRRVKAAMPEIKAALPAAIDVSLVMDRSKTIQAALLEVERSLMISVFLVILVVFAFLRNARAAMVPSVAVPVSLIGTFGVMYLLGYSLDNLSLMALAIATGFVVDDAIVVLENITRHVEQGMPRFEAALRGAREVGFTVLSMSLSLIAVFLPILLMGGIIGRLFREFAVTLSIAVLISLLVSLTATPMMCARLLKLKPEREEGWLARGAERVFAVLLDRYERSLSWALRHARTIMLILLATLALNVYLFAVVPKTFFPPQDTGRLIGGILADQSISFQAMRKKLGSFIAIIRHDPAVANVVGFTGGRQTNFGFVFVSLKPESERKASADQIIARLRRKLAVVPGARLFLQAARDIRAGGRAANAEYQYTLEGNNLAELYHWGPLLLKALRGLPELRDVNSTSEQDRGLEADLVIDRATAARLGLSMSQIDNTLYDAFGQRQVSTIFNPLNQYHVVMEVAPRFWQSPKALKDIYVSTAGGAVSGSAATNAVAGTTLAGTQGPSLAELSQNAALNRAANSIAAIGHAAVSTGVAVSTHAETMVPLAAFAHYQPGHTPLAVNHQGLFPATTISFNLAQGVTLDQAARAIARTMAEIGVPGSIHGSFEGTAKVFMQSLATEPFLIVAALLAVYIVLGILYESYVHPLTILSTLPSAGVGAVLALMICRTPFSIIALIGVILLIGIVKKNAIMMIDFALDLERRQGLSSDVAIYEACLRRFRPILMTTMAAMLGALPLAIGFGQGGSLRRPLGIAIVGGLMVSQLLTLYTTPVIYLYLDRFRLWCRRKWSGRRGGAMAERA